MVRRFVPQMTLLAVAALALTIAGCGSGGSSSETEDSGVTSTDTGTEFQESPVMSDTRGGTGSDGGLETVYFDYDRFNIRDDQRNALRGNATLIIANSDWGQVTIEGNCDERGSAEYNLALGERRANATRSYLVDLGVPSSKMSTVSFGDAKPAVQGHDESAWRWNRRTDFRLGR